MPRKLGSAVLAVALGGGAPMMAATGQGAEPGREPAFRHRLSAEVAAAIEPAVEGAARRFAQPACGGRLLSDFMDTEGRPLEERLALMGLEREAYLRIVVFVDGRHTRICQKRGVLAMSNPGGRLVGLCPAFLRALHWDRRLCERIIIHETLHSLGLGENPPSSLEIDNHIIDRCGR